MSADLLDRIGVALALGTATPTEALQALLLEAGGERCWQRSRLTHRLTLLLHSTRPPMATSTTHRFKAAFAKPDFSGFPLVIGDKTKIVTAHNLANEDVELLQRHGGGHLIEPIAGAKTPADVAAPQTVNSGILKTATEQTDDSLIIKHSSGGPDDLPIEAPVALQAEATTPDALSAKQAEEKPAAQPATDPKKKK